MRSSNLKLGYFVDIETIHLETLGSQSLLYHLDNGVAGWRVVYLRASISL